MMWHIGAGWGWWMLLGWVWMLVFWGLIVYAVYALTRGRGSDAPPGRPRQEQPSALEILEQRYARGELTHDQFEEMRRHLLDVRERVGS